MAAANYTTTPPVRRPGDATIKKALAILASRVREPGVSLSSPESVRKFLMLRMAELPYEVFALMLLDAQNRLIDYHELFRGTLTQTSVYPREVVKLALEANAAAVIFAHNHPPGAVQQSHADEMITRNLKTALSTVDIKTHDHFIVAGMAEPLSFTERGLLYDWPATPPSRIAPPAAPDPAKRRRGRPPKNASAA